MALRPRRGQGQGGSQKLQGLWGLPARAKEVAGRVGYRGMSKKSTMRLIEASSYVQLPDTEGANTERVRARMNS